MPRFELPFTCGTVWAGQTRTSHSPRNAIDFNRRNDFGDRVRAAAGGVVTRAEHGGNQSYGLWVDHGRTAFFHGTRNYTSFNCR